MADAQTMGTIIKRLEGRKRPTLSGLVRITGVLGEETERIARHIECSPEVPDDELIKTVVLEPLRSALQKLLEKGIVVRRGGFYQLKQS